MKLYIANCTKQAHDFAYRLPEGGNRMQRIEIGQQIVLAGNLSQPDVDEVLKHHGRYGMKSVEDARKAKDFTGLVYSIDKPVKVENMEIVLAKNDQFLTERGQRQRVEAAVAATGNIIRDGNQGLQALETSVVEVRKDGGESEVQEGVRVDLGANPDAHHLSGHAAKQAIKGGGKHGR